MKATNPSVVKINNVDVNVLSVDTGAYPDVGIADILAYNHIDNPSAQGTTLRAGLAGRFDLLTCGLPAIPVILYGNRYPTVGSLVLYKMTVMTKEQEFTASVTGGATVTATADGLVVQMPATPGDVVLTVNHYAFRIVVQDQAAVNPYIADQIIVANGIVPDPAMGGFGNSAKISKDGNTLIAGIKGYDVDGVTPLNYLVVFTKVQNGNKYRWLVNALLPPASPNTGASFGAYANDINADGTIIVVGTHDSDRTDAPFSPEAPGIRMGDVTIYKKSGNTWSYGLRVVSDVGRFSYGTSVAISDSGTQIVVGQPAIDNQSTTTDIATSIQVLSYDPTTHSIIKTYRITPISTEMKGSKFGIGVGINSDGTKVFASNFFYSGDQVVSRIEEYVSSGVNDVNTPLFILTKASWFDNDVAGQVYPGDCRSYGENTLIVSNDSNTLIVGFSLASVGFESGCGLVQVLKRQGNSWVKHSELLPPTGVRIATVFGCAIDATADLGYLFIGSSEFYTDGPYDSGSVHVFKYDAQTDSYSPIERIRSEIPFAGGAFGCGITYDHVSKYLVVSQQANWDAMTNGTFHYIPVGSLIV